MKKMLMLPLICAAMLLSSCAGLGALMTGPPPQAPAQVQTISRTAIDFALHSFDAALYGLDFAMDSHRIVPGSDNARRIAAAGRQVMNFLGAADAAQRLGSSATYEEAFAHAGTALEQFRQLLGITPAAMWIAADQPRPPLTDAQRWAILDRLDAGRPTV